MINQHSFDQLNSLSMIETLATDEAILPIILSRRGWHCIIDNLIVQIKEAVLRGGASLWHRVHRTPFGEKLYYLYIIKLNTFDIEPPSAKIMFSVYKIDIEHLRLIFLLNPLCENPSSASSSPKYLKVTLI